MTSNKLYSPSGFRDDHFGAQLVELIPQFFRFQVTLHWLQVIAITGTL